MRMGPDAENHNRKADAGRETVDKKWKTDGR